MLDRRRLTLLNGAMKETSLYVNEHRQRLTEEYNNIDEEEEKSNFFFYVEVNWTFVYTYAREAC